MKGLLYLAAGIGLIFCAFPRLRGKRSRYPLTTEQKIWRCLLFISALILIALGGMLLFRAFTSNAP
jgi:hypothetical protein